MYSPKRRFRLFRHPGWTVATITSIELTNSGSNDVFIVKYNTSGGLLWGRKITGTGSDIGRGISTDPTGNVYVAGQYASNPLTVFDTDNTTSFTTLPTPGSIFIAKYDTLGKPLWVRRVGGGPTNIAVSTDASGNVYVTGQYTTTFTVYNTDNSTTFTTMTAVTSTDVFIVKYDTSGTPLWSRKIAGAGNSDAGLGISVDSVGNVYAIGQYNSASLAIFDTDNTASFTSIPRQGLLDTFVVKYDTSGTPLWVRRIGGVANDIGNGIITDTSGNVYVIGNYASPSLAIFDTDNVTPFASLSTLFASDVFVVKYDTNGSPQWVRKIGSEFNDTGFEISADSVGNVYVIGSYQSLVTIYNTDNSTAFTTLANQGNNDVFVVKYDTSGTPLWGRRIGGTGSDLGNGISTDSSGNVYVTGQYTSSPVTIFDTDNSTTFTTLTNSGSDDVFVAKYNTSGTPLWATKITGSASDIGLSISADPTGNVYLTGQYASNPLTITGV